MTPYEQIQEKIAQLDAALNAKVPNFTGILRSIHSHLKKDPEIVTLMTPEECNKVVEGLKEQTHTFFAEKALKSGNKKALNKTTLLDL